MGIRDKFEQPVLQIPLPSPDQISPEQRRYEEIAREKGFKRPSDMTWGDANAIKQEVNREKYGNYPSRNLD